MLKTKTMREAVGLNPEETEEKTVPDLFEAEIAETLIEMGVLHSDSPEFGNAVKHLSTLTESLYNYEKAVTEREKTAVERERTAVEREKIVKDKWYKVMDVAPRCVGLMASCGLTALLFMVEQNHPISNRIANRVNDFLVRP